MKGQSLAHHKRDLVYLTGYLDIYQGTNNFYIVMYLPVYEINYGIFLFVQDISGELEVKDLETVIPRIQRMAKQLEEVSRYEEVSCDRVLP